LQDSSEQQLRPAWWLPSLTEAVFASVLFWLLAAGHAKALLADGDTGWHIRVGDFILAERRFPTSDLFSFSRPGAEWFAWEWGSDVLFALAHRLGGLGGVVLLAGLVIAGTSAALFYFLAWERVNVIVAVIAMLAAGSASTVHWLARPHVFTYLLFVLSLWILEADRRQPGRRVWVLVPLAVLWTNLHGGFVVLIVLLGLYVAGSLVEARRSSARRYALLALAAAAGTLVNPYGPRLHFHIAQYLRSDFIRDRVEEFQSPRFRGESIFVFELLLVAGWMIVPRLWRRREYAPALLLMVLSHAALVSVRHVLLYVLAAAPVVAREATTILASRQNEWWAVLSSLGHARSSREIGRPWYWPPLWAAAAVLTTAGLFQAGGARWKVDFPAEKFPHNALAATEKKGLGRRIFTSDQWADYLIYRYYPQTRVFIDGRSDFYGAAIGQQYLEALSAHHRWQEIFDRHDFDVVLTPPEWPLATVLKAHPDWRLEYDDGQALVLRRVWRTPVVSAN